jgi:hypothetical protein
VVIELLSSLWDERVVVMIEDAQWMDEASTELLRALASATRRPSLGRVPQPSREPPAMTSMGRGPLLFPSGRSTKRRSHALAVLATAEAPLPLTTW